MPSFDEGMPSETAAIFDPFASVEQRIICSLPFDTEYSDEELAAIMEEQMWYENDYAEKGGSDGSTLKAYREFTSRSWRERGFVSAKGYTPRRMQNIRTQALRSMGLEMEGDDDASQEETN